ncbi:MAG: winged helix-turn-helix transcriptional regulator [Candidatus Bathyarchaeota archaeon]|nr:MAG: winged helix-turn-helix transcriptional regulator [Candidatus Bathyarchaeota archaeon]
MRGAYHPKAFLSLKRNIRPGLIARTQIVLQLEKDALSVRDVAQHAKLSYAAALHHIRLLEAENILVRRGKKPFRWELTGVGQQRLT